MSPAKQALRFQTNFQILFVPRSRHEPLERKTQTVLVLILT